MHATSKGASYPRNRISHFSFYVLAEGEPFAFVVGKGQVIKGE